MVSVLDVDFVINNKLHPQNVQIKNKNITQH